ncbi:MAG TPA: aspartyl/asparaginyl beta-hydroxylase domain-containing protein [bacterium]|nr:aspartyl/asparaginyl beta-hydroxylase domain-containing protein [bacterium]
MQPPPLIADFHYDHPFCQERRALIVQKMKSGGYWKRVMSAGPELDRLKEFLSLVESQKHLPESSPLQRPNFLPLYPGVSYRPFYDPKDFDWVKPVEEAYPVILSEMETLGNDPLYVEYSPPIKASGSWSAVPFYYMGLKIPLSASVCPRTAAFLEKLPGNCFLYPWGDALFSRHMPGTHLKAHCSVDGFRLRCHLGLKITEGAVMRVGSETRTWEEGKVLLFDDSFEHEVWNRGTQPRTILIVDFWHPELNPSEIRAIEAGFRKSEIRALMYTIRLLNASEETHQQILQAFAMEDADPVIRSFWD